MATSKPAAKPAAKSTAKPTSKAVVPAKQQALAKSDLTEQQASMYLEQAGAGMENATAQDYALPFINLLQLLSPELDEDNDRFIEGATVGEYLNTVTKEIYGDTIEVIPVDFNKVYNEWVPREQGGGFVKSYNDKSEAEQNCQEGNTIVDTANHYVLIKNGEGEWEHAILSMTSTKLAASRNWMSRMSQVMIPGPNGKIVAPSFARVYEITADKKKNNKGTFFVPVVKPVEGADGWVPANLFERAMDFRAQLKAGQKGADFTKNGDTVDAEVLDDDGEAM